MEPAHLHGVMKGFSTESASSKQMRHWTCSLSFLGISPGFALLHEGDGVKITFLLTSFKRIVLRVPAVTTDQHCSQNLAWLPNLQ